MYSGLRLCVDTLGVICVVLGVGLFSGTKRETLWDRNNVLGLLFIAIALWHMAVSIRALKPCFRVSYSAGAVPQQRPLLPQAGFGRTAPATHQGKTRGMHLIVLSIPSEVT